MDDLAAEELHYSRMLLVVLLFVLMDDLAAMQTTEKNDGAFSVLILILMDDLAAHPQN